MTMPNLLLTKPARFAFARPLPRELLLIFLAAFGYFLAFPNPLMQIPPAGLLMPAAIFLLSLEASTRFRALFFSFLCMFAGSSAALYWLSIPMREFAGVPLPLAACFVMLLGAYLGLYGVLFALLARFFTRHFRPLAALPVLALGWGALELLRGWFLTGFPWLSLSSAFVGWPLLAQGSALFGMYGLSALYALVALPPALIFLQPENAWPASPLRAARPAGKKVLPCLAVPLALLVFLAGYGFLRLQVDWLERDRESGRVKLVGLAQASIGQAYKWNQDMRRFTIRRYLELSQDALRISEEHFERRPDLIVWPETAMPFMFQRDPELAAPLRAWAASRGIPLLFGAQGADFSPGLDDYYNRVLLLDKYGREAGFYDKEHLVPFGEYIPPGLYVPFASEFLQGTGFTPGTATGPLRLDDFALGLLICYEVIFPELAQARAKAGANLLASVSNDAWFGKSSAPVQHLQLAAQRCIEQGRYMARATNTGISAVIDPAGRIHGPSKLFTPWAQTEEVALIEETTFYHNWYAQITVILWLAPLMMFVLGLGRALGRTLFGKKAG